MRRSRLSPQVTLCLLFLLVSSVEAQNEEIDKNVTAAIIFVSIPVLVFMLLISLFGHRMRSTAIRFHAINISIWGLMQMAQCSAFPVERAPFKNWFKSKEWKDNQAAIDAMNRSVFPTGLIFLFIEQIILICAPSLENNWIFNIIFGTLILGFVNITNFVLYNSRYWGIEIWYDLLKLYNLGITIIHMIAMAVYFFFCIIGSFCCCVCLGMKKRKRRPGLFVNMWLLFAYGMVAVIMTIPTFTSTMMEFAFAKLMEWFEEIGLVKMILDMMTGGGEGGSPLPSFITMEMITALIDWTLSSQPWMTVLFPIVHCTMTLILFAPFREQLFYFASCGRLHKERVPHWEKGKKQKVVVRVPPGLPAPIQTATFAPPPPGPVFYAPVTYANGAYPVQAAIPAILPEKPQENPEPKEEPVIEAISETVKT